MKKCPFCGESIRVAAIKCRYCGEFLPRPEKRPPLPPRPALRIDPAADARVHATVQSGVNAIPDNPFLDDVSQLHTTAPPEPGYYAVLFFDECEGADDPNRPTRAGMRTARWDGEIWRHEDHQPIERHGMQVFGWYRRVEVVRTKGVRPPRTRN